MKNLFIILVSSFLVALIATSCEKDVVLDLGEVEEKLVVEGAVIEGEPPMVFLSRTYPTYGTNNFVELIDSMFIEGAVVEVTDQSGTTVTLTETTVGELSNIQKIFLPQEYLVFGQIAQIPVYTDTTNTIIGMANGTYTLNITYEGENLSSSTTIPSPRPLDSLSFERKQNLDSFYTVYLHLSIFPPLGNYVRYATQRNSEPFFYPSATGANWTDQTFEGAQNLKLPAERGYGRNDSSDVDINEFGAFLLGDTVTVMWNDIDRDTYLFWNSIDNDGGDTPFSSPVRAETNIEGGLGVFAGYNQSFTSIIITE